jgi:hypothetical protein
MATYGKNKKRIKLYGGNHAEVEKDGAYIHLGDLAEVTLDDETSTITVPSEDGDEMDFEGTRKVTVTIVLNQTDKDELELVDLLRGETVRIYIYRGILDDNHLGLFFEAASVIPKLSLKSPDTPQKITLAFGIQKQSAAVECVPDTDLPAGAEFTGLVAQTGLNNYYVNLKQAVA